MTGHDETVGIVFHREDDGSITAETSRRGRSGGDTRSEALARLVERLPPREIRIEPNGTGDR